MTNMLRKIVQITIPVLCGLIVLHAYLVSKNLKLIEKNTIYRVEASEMQADTLSILLDLQDMETGQRGYLLSGDASYLQPYNEASQRLPVHFAKLRSRLSGKTPQERSTETQLESLAEAKIEEMKETIRLREAGYRHRAFLVVSSNRGKELMDETRKKLGSLSSAQISNVVQYDRQMRAGVARAVQEAAVASCVLFMVAVITFVAFNSYRWRLEVASARQVEELRATSLQLDRFASTILQDFRVLVEEMRSYAHSLLDAYGGFLPRHGQEKAARIENGAGQMIRLLDDLSKNSPAGDSMYHNATCTDKRAHSVAGESTDTAA